MMTKKHFEAIAKVLRETPVFEIETDGVPMITSDDEFRVPCPDSIRRVICARTLAVELADAFALDNPRFDKGRFLKAANPNANAADLNGGK